MRPQDRHACPSCGNELSEATESCPVCMFRVGLAGGVESGESSSEGALEPTSQDGPTDLSIMNCSRAKTGSHSNWVAVQWASLTRRSTWVFTVL